MGKRDGNKFQRVDKDYYPTIDPSCLVPAFTDAIFYSEYAEPCYGDGSLENLLHNVAVCKWRSDIRETTNNSLIWDATKLTTANLKEVDCIITNPPYKWKLLKPLLDHLPSLKPTWLLLPSDYMFNIRMGPYIKKCSKIIAIGRMYWLPNKVKGVSNMAWYCFEDYEVPTKFIGR